MKKILLVLVLVVSCYVTYAQDYSLQVVPGPGDHYIVQIVFNGVGTPPAINESINDLSFSLRWPSAAGLNGENAPVSSLFGVISGGLETENFNSGGFDYIPFNLPFTGSQFPSTMVVGVFYDVMEFSFDAVIPNGTAGDIEIAPTGTAPNPGTPFIQAIINGGAIFVNENMGVLASSPLPIELIEFTAEKSGRNSSDLNWVTAKEQNASHFEIERSSGDLDDWKYIGEVEATGESNSLVNYSFLDENINLSSLENNTAYYRLKMVDNSGVFEYTDLRAVQFDRNEIEVNVYPNPTSDYLNVVLNKEDNVKDNKVNLKVYGIDGRLVLNKNQHSSEPISEDISGLASGTYQIIIEFNNNIYTHKFIKSE